MLRFIVSRLVQQGEDFSVVYRRKQCFRAANQKGALTDFLCDSSSTERFEIRGGVLTAGSDSGLATPMSVDSVVMAKWLCARPFEPERPAFCHE